MELYELKKWVFPYYFFQWWPQLKRTSAFTGVNEAPATCTVLRTSWSLMDTNCLKLPPVMRRNVMGINMKLQRRSPLMVHWMDYQRTQELMLVWRRLLRKATWMTMKVVTSSKGSNLVLGIRRTFGARPILIAQKEGKHLGFLQLICRQKSVLSSPPPFIYLFFFCFACDYILTSAFSNETISLVIFLYVAWIKIQRRNPEQPEPSLNWFPTV